MVALEQPRIERQRQQILQSMPSGLAGEIGEHDVEIAAELPQDLAARAARRRRRFGVGDDGGIRVSMTSRLVDGPSHPL